MSGLQPISTAPRDGTPFMWLHYIKVLHPGGKPVEYKPYAQVIRRTWVGEKVGAGYWMGEYSSKSDYDLMHGWWLPLPDPESQPHTSIEELRVLQGRA